LHDGSAGLIAGQGLCEWRASRDSDAAWMLSAADPLSNRVTSIRAR